MLNGSQGYDAPEIDGVTGVLSRLEYRHYALPWLGSQARFMGGVELTYDKERDSQVWAFARIRIPLSPRRAAPQLDPLSRRFADVPIREID